ncbi:hypothetical protein P4O66_021169, partial [Electrophorus voltai]
QHYWSVFVSVKQAVRQLKRWSFSHCHAFDMLGQKLSDVMDVPSELDLSALPGVASLRQQSSGAAGTQDKPQEMQNDKLGENSSPQPGMCTHWHLQTPGGGFSLGDSMDHAHLCLRLHVTGTPTVEGCLEPRERRKRGRSSVAASTQPMQENPPYLWEHSLSSHQGRVSLEDLGGPWWWSRIRCCRVLPTLTGLPDPYDYDYQYPGSDSAGSYYPPTDYQEDYSRSEEYVDVGLRSDTESDRSEDPSVEVEEARHEDPSCGL